VTDEKYEFLNRMLLQFQRESSLPWSLRPRHKALVPVSWNRGWERFIIGDCDQFFERINTESLLNSAGTGLDAAKYYSVDYCTASIEAWIFLSSFYGSGPLISYDFQTSRVRVGADPDGLLSENAIYEKLWDFTDEV